MGCEYSLSHVTRAPLSSGLCEHAHTWTSWRKDYRPWATRDLVHPARAWTSVPWKLVAASSQRLKYYFKNVKTYFRRVLWLHCTSRFGLYHTYINIPEFEHSGTQLANFSYKSLKSALILTWEPKTFCGSWHGFCLLLLGRLPCLVYERRYLLIAVVEPSVNSDTGAACPVGRCIGWWWWTKQTASWASSRCQTFCRPWSSRPQVRAPALGPSLCTGRAGNSCFSGTRASVTRGHLCGFPL